MTVNIQTLETTENKENHSCDLNLLSRSLKSNIPYLILVMGNNELHICFDLVITLFEA